MSPVRPGVETWDETQRSDGTPAGVGWQRVLDLDASLLILARRCEKEWLTPLMQALTRLGDTATWLILALVFATFGGDGPRCALLLVSGALTAVTVSQVLKRVFRRTRPSAAGLRGFATLTRDPDAFSFPSGHTAVAFAVAVALTGEGEGLLWVLLPLATGIGASRVYLGAHYPLDVLTGAMVGVGSGLVVRSLFDGSLQLGLQTLAALVSLA